MPRSLSLSSSSEILRATICIASYDTRTRYCQGASFGRPRRRATATPASPAEQLRLRFAEAWGEMSASWGVAPAIGRVHAYLMVRNEPLDGARDPRGARPLASGRQPRPRRRRGVGDRRARRRSRAGSDVAGPPARRTSRSATTGSGSPGSSPSGRSARATRSSRSSTAPPRRPATWRARIPATRAGGAPRLARARSTRSSGCSIGPSG